MLDVMNDAVKYLYSLGCYFIPVDGGTKEPGQIDGRYIGVTNATRDLDKINSWLVNDFGLGIAGGKLYGTNRYLVILDADVKIESGLETKSKLEDEYGQLPRTLEVKTPSGGRHFYYTSKVQIGSSSDVFRMKFGQRSGIDVKGYHGYVCCPPTRGYELVTNKDIEFKALPEDWEMYLTSFVGARTNLVNRISETFSIPPNVDEVTHLNKKFTINQALEKFGYTRCGKNTYRHPFGSTSERNVVILKNEGMLKHGADYISWHYGAHDRVQGGPHDSFDIVRLLTFDGDWDRTVVAVKEDMNIKDGRIFGTANDIDKVSRQELISNHWKVNDIVLLSGASEAYKTFFVIDAAFSMATGLPFLNKFPVRRCQSVLVLTESVGDFYDRREAWVRTRSEQHGIEAAELRDRLKDVYYYFNPLKILSEDSLTAFAKLTEMYKKDFHPQCYFFDHLSSNWGGKDENSNAEMANYLSALRQFARNDNLTIVVIHHPTKAGVEARGASCLRNNCPVVYEFKIDQDSKKRTVNQTKCSYANSFKSYGLESNLVQLYEDKDAVIAGTWRSGMSISYKEIVPPIMGRPQKVQDKDILDIIGNYEVTTSELAKKVGLTEKGILLRLKSLEDNGLVMSSGSAKRFVWSLTDEVEE